MAVVANLCLPGWDEWRREMLEKRRRRWRERVKARVRVSLGAKVHVCIEEEEVEAGEAEAMGIEEEKVSRDDEAGEKGEVKEEGAMMREAEETEEVGENDIGRGVKDAEDGSNVIGADERVNGVEEDKKEENELLREVKEDGEDNKEVLDPDERVDEEDNGEENEVVDKDEEDEVTEAEDLEKEEDREVKENEEVAEDEEVNEFEREVEEAEKFEGGGEEGENRADLEEDRQVREEQQVEEEEAGEEEHQEQEQIGQFHLAEGGIEDENIRQNQESPRQEPETVSEEENLAYSVESSYEDSDWTGSDDEFYNFDRMQSEERAVENQYEVPNELEDLDEKSVRNENSILGAWTSTERKAEEDESKKLADEKETVAESPSTQEEELQADSKKLQEEEAESTDDEEGEHSVDEEDEEDEVKIYCKDDYCTDVFRILTEFRDSSILTDLTLSTEDGNSFQVHSPVLAAVSSHIRESLHRKNTKRYNDKVGVHRWSLSLGPEVNHVGLKAVVEFAYNGFIPSFNMRALRQIREAAQTLGAPRVLDVCKEEEEKPTKPRAQRKAERISAAEQMMTSLQSIKQLWTDRVGCDVILEALGGSLHVHRVILAVCSDYFRGMFTSGMRESNQSCVALPSLLASELAVLIDCSYSGALPLSWKCVFELTITALQLQYQPALCLCLDFLHQEINPHSCLDVASFAEAFEMEQLLEVADDFVLRQFQKVACIPKFKDLPAQQLLKYLNSRSLCVPSELVVFKAVATWIQARPKVRLKIAKELMKTIHFPLMTFKEFKEVQSLKMWSDHSLAELYEAIFEDFCSSEGQCRVYLPKESLVLIGGEQISDDLCKRSISRELWFGNSLRNHTGVKKAMEWRKLVDMLPATPPGEFRPRNCIQHTLPAFTDIVEQYCPTANSWSYVWPLDVPMCGHVAKVLQGQVFVSGGLSSDNEYLASMFLYHPKKGSNYLANMAKPRAHHCMEPLDGCLYVAGGVTKDDTKGVIDQLACEVYDPVADSWTAFTSLPVPHVGAGGVVLEGKFYVLGGYSQDDYSDTKMVHRYDPATQKWENMGKMPGPNNDIRASLLCLPSHYRL
ncbi:uncharacterized protein LOC121962443 [Plectropomus leopardus]|uniref:uncharacterized protein LOC121962443 n=1 Tax=Plectropomus leopardus TaxID=160734 RepID=UPI001C4B03D6|nr:uncharacterized protein LOC121962443 [Plectropomus leopardus]